MEFKLNKKKLCETCNEWKEERQFYPKGDTCRSCHKKPIKRKSRVVMAEIREDKFRATQKLRLQYTAVKYSLILVGVALFVTGLAKSDVVLMGIPLVFALGYSTNLMLMDWFSARVAKVLDFDGQIKKMRRHNER